MGEKSDGKESNNRPSWRYNRLVRREEFCPFRGSLGGVLGGKGRAEENG